MTAPAHTATPARPRLLDLRSGGGVLLISAALCLIVLGQWLALLPQRRPVIGDGHSVASYGFDLSTCLVPRDELIAAGFPKDGLPAMADPPVMTIAEADAYAHELRRAHQGKFLVASDRVIGVVVDGVARAYPLRLLTWHEVANDTLAGRPIVVTYNPLCDSVVVFDRRVRGQTLEFGVSGLVYNSNLLLYDRRSDRTQESLWSQLQFRAITGPAAARGDTFTLVPMVLVDWSDWCAQYPDTTVIAPDRSRYKIYKRTYAPYFGSQKLRYAVTPLPLPEPWPFKTPMVAVRTMGEWHAFAIADIVSHADANGTWNTPVDGVDVSFTCGHDGATVWPHVSSDTQFDTVYAFWFAWYAMQGASTSNLP